MLLLFFLFQQNIGGLAYYYTPYNYNGHSYYMSIFDYYNAYGYYFCMWFKYYGVDIQDQKENDAISSVMNNDEIIGIYRLGRGSHSFYSQHRQKIINYSNWENTDFSHKSWNTVQMSKLNGKWSLVYQWDQGYWMCENDKIASNGVNITSAKRINIPYDSMVSFRGHTYYIYKAFRSFATSREICNSDHGGYIFIPNDGTENCAIHEIVYATSFVGITNLGHNQYMTEKNYLANYLPWSSLKLIDKECVVRSFINGEFSTEDCSVGGHVICEYDAVVPGATPKDCKGENRHHYFSQIFYFHNISYYVFDFLSSRDEATSICTKRNSKLYVPFNSIENCAVIENVDFNVGINYGSIFLKHVLMRGDKFSSNFTNWKKTYPRDPHQHGCVHIEFSSGKWVNQKCQDTRFICYSNDDNYNYSNINCTNQFFHNENQAISKKIGGKVYTMFGRPLSFHDSVRLCTQFGLSMVQTTSNYIINELNKEIKRQRFFVDYRILWNDTKLTWLEKQPNNPPWASNEPFYNDEEIVCTTAAQNGSFVATRCKEQHIAVCVGYHAPSFAASISSSSKKKIGIGVGVFFGIGVVLAVIIGAFFYVRKHKRAPSISLSNALGSFRRTKKSTIEE